ncbi:uncharacterized protein [Enoplosus armatus]|uniref:uncharacterized protein n=1 Tax=Enoplosus armatus TaxID=215367 RepID=UPI00399643AC
MKVRHTWICFFVLTLRDGNTELIGAKTRRGTEGGNITVGCSFFFSGERRIFCKNKCKEKDILVDTTGDRAQRGRYSIDYVEGSLLSSALLYVSITNLKRSDSGWYRCSLERSWGTDSSEEFEIRVEEAPIPPKPNRTPRPFSTSVPSTSTTPPTAQSLSSSSGSAAPSSAPPEATRQTQRTPPAAAPAQTATGVLLSVGLTLVAMIVTLSVAVLIFCRKRAKEPPVEEEYINVTEPNRVYEEIREEDGRSRSPPVEISTVYKYAKYSKPHGGETTDAYSFVTAASSQGKTEDDGSELTYSQVAFSNSTAASLSGAPVGDADTVIYSVPRVAASSAGSHAEVAPPPLYSTVTLHQQ